MRLTFSTLRILSALLLALPMLSCTALVEIGRNGGTKVTREECGNGMDDDADGNIEEGCPCGVGESQSCYSGVYPNRLVGACRDGAQVCGPGEMSEFGRWGTCAGDTLPASEQCEGLIDEDCDGAVDEGCPCTTSEARPCGFGVATGVCVEGEQRCSEEGLWSACLGAIGPGPEVCFDGLDNDCDGSADEGCDCVPSSEICADGLDNDCDGVADEAACSGGAWDSWGDYAASLPLPGCPPGEVLIVDTLGAELDGGESLDDPADAGAELSFVEALFIAKNTASATTIYFDAGVFPPLSPGTILLPHSLQMAADISDVCIDARNRGVILERELTPDPSCPNCMTSFSDGAQVYGLEWRAQPGELGLRGTAQIAGCRFNSDGHQVTPTDNRPWVLQPRGGAQVGPGNAIFGRIGIRTLDFASPSPARVFGNHFGHDPVTHFTAALDEAVDLRAPLEFQDNVVVARRAFGLPQSEMSLVIGANRFGVDRQGHLLAGASGISVQGGAVVGPGNIFRGVGVAIEVVAGSVAITENRIWEVPVPIRFLESAPHAPPTLTSATTARIEGTCEVPGRVELFSDEADGAERFEGALSCEADIRWRFEGSLPSGRRITATLTSIAGATSALANSLPIAD